MSISAPTTFQRPDLGMAYHEYDYEAEQMGYIAQRVLPVFPAAKVTGSFTVIPRSELMKDVPTEHASGTGYHRDKAKIEQQHYTCKEHGVEEPVDLREAASYMYSFDYEMIVAARASSKLWRAMEIRAAAAIFNTTVWTGSALTTNVSVKWTTSATAKPIDDVQNAILSVRATCGQKPNAVIISFSTFMALQKCTQIIDRLKYSGIDDPKVITVQQLAALFMVDEVIIADNMRNTANSAQAESLSDIWAADMAMVARLAPRNGARADLSKNCLGRTFAFTGETGQVPAMSDGGAPSGLVFEQYPEPQTNSIIIRARMDYDQKVIDPNCGHLLTNLA